MLPRRERLGTTAFASAFDKGRILRHPLLQLRVHVRGDNELATRAAFVVSKKLGKATVRNRARRRIREIYRLTAARHHGHLAGLDLIFLATALALTAERAQLQAAIEQLLRRVVNTVVNTAQGATENAADSGVGRRDAVLRKARNEAGEQGQSEMTPR